MKRERLSREDVARLAADRPARRVHRDAPDLPVHLHGFTEPTPCGLPVGAWAARTNRADLVTCPSCRQLRRVYLVPVPGGPTPPVEVTLPALRALAAAFEGTRLVLR